MSRVLVTGATGGLGIAVVDVLAKEGHQVRATGRRPIAADRFRMPGVEFVRADLLDPTALPGLVNGMTAVVHCAALSSPWGRKADFHAINVTATVRLLAEARKAGVRRFVFISSPSVYARTADQLGLGETDAIAPRPLNAYAATKAIAERHVLAASGPDMACSVLRPRAIVGPDDEVLLPRILKLVRRGRFPLLRDGKALIELTDVRDVAQAIRLALSEDGRADGEIFNISGGRAMTVRAMIESLSDAVEIPVRFLPLSLSLASTVAHGAEWICSNLPGRPEPPVTPYSLAVLAFSQTFDLSKARERLGYVPRHDAFVTALSVARSRVP